MAGNFERNEDILRVIQDVAKAHAATPAQVALAWLLARPHGVVPIPGTRRVARVEQNIDAVDLMLSPDELQLLDGVIPDSGVAGARYHEAAMRRIEPS